jgi:hypothetical protein
MRSRSLRLIAALLLPLACGSVALAQTARPSGQGKTSASAPVAAHDLSGVWQLVGLLRSMSKAGPSLTTEGNKKFLANLPGFGPRAVPGGNDPIGQCDPLGLPRTLLSERPIQFVEIPGRMLQFLESDRTWRDIWTDGRELAKDQDERWYGFSVGKWQGDTFVVDSSGFDERTWVDSLGYPRSDVMRLQERYRRPDHDTIELAMTIDDPKMYTKPWVSDKLTYKLQSQDALEEGFCVASEEESFTRRLRNPAAGKP